MSIAETQELVARLRLDATQYEAALGQVGAKTAAFERQINRIGQAVNASVGAQTAAMRAQAAELEKIAAQSTLVGTGGRAPVSSQAKAAAAAEAKALRANAQALEDSLAQGTLAYEQRAAAAVAANAEAAASEVALRDSIRATTAAEVRAAEVQAAQAAKISKNIGRIGVGAKTAAGGALKFLETTTLAAAAAGGVLELSFIKVQDAQAAFARTLTGDSVPAIQAAVDGVLQLSKVVPLSVTELYKIAEVIGTTKVAAGSVAALTETVAKLAVTTDLSSEEAAIGLARLLNMFGQINDKGEIATGAAEHLADAIFRSSLAFSSSDQEVLRASLRFGALSAAMGLTQGQVIALAGAVTGLGQEPEAVGGSFQRLFQIINKAVGEADKLGKVTPELAEMAKLANLSPAAFSQGIKEDAFNTFIKLVEGFSKLSPTEQAVLFGKGGIFPSFVRGAQTLQNLGIAFGDVVDQAKEYDAATAESSKLNEAFALRVDTLAKRFQLLGNALLRGAVAFGSAFDEELGGAIQRVTDYLTDNEAVFAEWGRKVADAIRSINWDEVKGFVSTFFGVFKTGLETTKALLDILGPDLTAFLLLFKTVNSLSGGAIGKLGGGLLGGLGGLIAKALGTAFASSGIGKFFVQPVFVTNQGFGGPLALGAGTIASLASAFAIAIPVALASQAATNFVNDVLKEQGAKVGVTTPTFNNPLAAATNPLLMGQNFLMGVKLFGDIVDRFMHPGGSPQDPGFGHGSDVGGPSADRDLALLADYGRTEADLARQIAENTGGTEQGVASMTAKLLDALKPSHRRGEVGKSIETTEGRRLKNLDLTSPNFAATLGLVDKLVEHYTKEPIGTKGHSRAFVLGNVNPVENRLGTLLARAIKNGNQEKQQQLIAALKNLDSIPKNDLPAWIRKLIRSSEKGHEQTKHAIDQEKRKLAGGIETSADRIAMLRRTLQQKKLAVSYKPASVHVHPGHVVVGPTYVRATIGTRNVLRATRRSVAYGPGYTYEGTGMVSLYGDSIR